MLRKLHPTRKPWAEARNKPKNRKVFQPLASHLLDKPFPAAAGNAIRGSAPSAAKQKVSNAREEQDSLGRWLAHEQVETIKINHPPKAAKDIHASLPRFDYV